MDEKAHAREHVAGGSEKALARGFQAQVSTPLDHDVGTTADDRKDLTRMGKEQQFNRNFRQFSMICFTSMIQATWEITLIANYQGLTNGGTGAFFWSYLWTLAGFLFIVLSLAEMASMAPCSGGQYHWVSEFSPPSLQQYMSYASGWLSTTSWQAGTAGGCYIVSSILQALVVAYDEHYVLKHWHTVLMVIGVNVLCAGINLLAPEGLPLIETVMTVVHAAGWFVAIGLLGSLAPHYNAGRAFTSFTSTGWHNLGVSVLVGQITAAYCLILSDSAAHLSEETSGAAQAVPTAMIWSFCVNGIFGFAMLIAFICSIGDLDAALADPSGWPFIYVFNQASKAGTIVITVMIFLVAIFGTLGSNASTSRQTFAFARDHGLPFSKWLSKVGTKHHIPANAVIITCVISILLNLITLGSLTAFNALISLQLIALMATYTLSIGSVLWRRAFSNRPLPPAKFSLGRHGIWINSLGAFYSAWIMFWCAWPPYGGADLTPDNYNWAPVMFVGIMTISVLLFYGGARKRYVGPVVLVKQTSPE